MSKQVVVIASGETEHRAIPHLVAHLQAEDIVVVAVRIPARGKALNVEMAEKLVKAAWFERSATPPAKFVILVDTDGKTEDLVQGPFREQLAARIGANINPQLQYAWRTVASRGPGFSPIAQDSEDTSSETGHVDSSKPDEIRNPKLHLEHLLGVRAYTAVISEEIAKRLNAETIGQRSPSFQGFLEAVRNGHFIVQDQGGG